MIKLNGYEIKPTIFPDNTSQVWRLNEGIFSEYNVINWEYENDAEFIQVAQLVDLLNEISTGVSELIIPFMPYSRQDKPVTNTSTFGKFTFCKLLNMLKVQSIHTIDCHSSKYMLGIHNISPAHFIYSALRTSNPDTICFPDEGAYRRYNHESCFEGYPTATLLKNRNPLTGEIEGLSLINRDIIDLKNKKVLLCDDLCDGGRTFIEAAKLLKNLGAKTVDLYTTHGIYSKGVQILFDSGINRIFNYNGEVINDSFK